MVQRFDSLLVLLAVVAAGCNRYGENAQPGEGVADHMAVQEARSMVYVLDYLVREARLDEVPRLYTQMEYIYTDPASAAHFSEFQETYDELKMLVAEVKQMLPDHRDNLEPVKVKIERMVELADSMPGGDIKLAEVWDVP